MKCSVGYLNSIQVPTTDDFENFFRILLLELQSQANNRKWNFINPFHFSYFEYSCYNYYEVGIKAVLLSYEGDEFPFGVKCKISCACLNFYIFDSKGIFDDKPDSSSTYERETYIKGGYARAYECFIDYLDIVSERISEMNKGEKYTLQIFELPCYNIQDIRHIDEWCRENTEIPF